MMNDEYSTMCSELMQLQYTIQSCEEQLKVAKAKYHELHVNVRQKYASKFLHGNFTYTKDQCPRCLSVTNIQILEACSHQLCVDCSTLDSSCVLCQDAVILAREEAEAEAKAKAKNRKRKLANLVNAN